MEYQPTIGLEIHAELKTLTKMFCDSLNDPDEKHPNTNVCPVCLGHPGTLPFINKKAVEAVIRVGLALGGEIAKTTKFDRKNYFYPDLPKGYQISQYDMPLVKGGELLGVRIRRVHLEEDTGTLIHDEKSGASLVDFNRAGVPLMELVTEPDINDAEDAVKFAKEFQLILRYLGVSSANMEKGEMRVEVNISLNMGTKVELKNINSFKAVESATAYEIKRQKEALELGEKIKQETRGWDDVKKITVSQREKEEAHDYRYFPEPDLPPFTTAEFEPERLKAELPELPAARRERFKKEYDLPTTKTEMLVVEPELAKFFEEAVSELRAENPSAQTDTLFNYLTSDLRGLMNETGVGFGEPKINPEHLAHIARLVDDSKITSRQAKDILREMFETGLDPEVIMAEGGFSVVKEGETFESAVKKVINENPAAVADYKKGKEASLQFLIGQTMKELKGKGHPEMIKKAILHELVSS